MNIIFFHSHAITPNSQGVSKVLITLRDLFREKGHKVIALAMHKLQSDTDVDDLQFFLPYDNIYSDENISFLCNLIKDYHIEKSINVCGNLDELHLAEVCCKECKIPLITAIHNMILTPIHNIAAVKEYSLRKHHLMIVYWLFQVPVIKRLIYYLYIFRYRKYYKSIYDRSDVVVLLNKAMELELLQMIGLSSSRKTFVIPNTLNDDPNNVCLNKENIVLWVGKMDTSIKRPDLMLRIWKKVEDAYPDWNLMMLGKGDGTGEKVWNEMILLAKQLKLKNISFEGQVKTQPYYNKAKISCVTSTHESFSLVLIESLYSGVVPMAFNSFPMAADIIEDNVNGLLVSPFDIEEYASKLKSVMSNCTRWKILHNNRKYSINKYSKDIVFKKWYKLFSSL